MQVAKSGEQIGPLEQRAIHVMPKPLKKPVGRCVEVDHLALRMQSPPVGRPQHRATSGRQHTLRVLGELGDHGFFDVTKPVFTFSLKILPDRAAQPLLNHLIRVKKLKLQSPCELPPNRGFTRPGETDQTDQETRWEQGGDRPRGRRRSGWQLKERV